MRENRPLNAETRAKAPGRFIDLPKGTVHYELSGPEDAQTIVLVHGALIPMFIWEYLVPVLRDLGYRVLRYDNYGRGWSDRPRARYDVDLYLDQLHGMLDALELKRPVHLVGVSQGGAISTAFTARYPDQVDKLALLAPAGLPRERAIPERLAVLPVLGEVLVRIAAAAIVLKGLQFNVNAPGSLERLRPLVAEQMHYRGFRRTLLAMLREFPMGGLMHAFEEVGRQERDIFLLWGTDDNVLPFELSHLARELLPNAEFHELEGAGHIAHWDEPKRVNPLLEAFFAPPSAST